LNVTGDIGATANQVAVTIWVGNPTDCWPVFASLQHPIQRIGGLLSRELVIPIWLEEILSSVRSILHDLRAGVDFLVDLDHRLSETIELAPTLSKNYLSSDSVGSTMRVPGTGKDIVGAWKPKSINLLATSSSETPVSFLREIRSIMNS
jgi:hypothetical protein